MVEEEVEEVVFTRDNRGGPAQHATRVEVVVVLTRGNRGGSAQHGVCLSDSITNEDRSPNACVKACKNLIRINC